MSDLDETFECYKREHGPNVGPVNTIHNWDIVYSNYIGQLGKGEETYYIFDGTQKGVKEDMKRIFKDNFEDEFTRDGCNIPTPTIVATCPHCDIDIVYEEGEA